MRFRTDIGDLFEQLEILHNPNSSYANRSDLNV